jgi:hypothetical protein
MKLRLAAALLALLPPAVAAQAGPAAVVGTDSVVLAPGLRYRGSRLHRFLYGSTYRDLWATPIKVPLLDLRRFAGGLLPVKRGGGNQTKSLRLKTADGTEYVFRLVDKDKVTIPAGFENTIVERITRNQVSAQHPAAAEVTAPLLEAAGVLHVTPILAAMPNDSLLGEFRGDFAGQLGMIERYPNMPDSAPGFAGAAGIIDSDELLKKLDADPAQQVDARGYLKARLMDMFINDWDRHPGQWKWARFDSSGAPNWEPIPRDRDKPFISHGGIVKATGIVSPNVMTFRVTYPSIHGLTWNALELDRRLLAGLEKPVWDSVADDLRHRITDAVIDAAAGAMPVEFRETAPHLAAVLRVRRDQIPEIATRFYRYLAQVLDIHATDAADRAVVTRRDDGSVEVELFSERGDRYFRRRFDPEETDQIRLYLHGGDDRASVVGSSAESIPVWIIGGNGVNRLVDSSSVHGKPHPTRLYDAGSVTGVGYGPDSAWNRRPWVTRSGKPAPPERDRGDRFAPGFALGSDRDIGLLIRMELDKYYYGFRRTPYSSRYALSEEYATRYQGHRVAALVDLRREASRIHFTGQARMSELEVINFHGLGNDSPDEASDFYQVRQRQWLLHPTIGLALGARGDLSAGPVVEYTTTDSVPDRFVSAHRPYGFGRFGQAGLRFNLSHDGRDRSTDPRRGVRLAASGTWYPALWDVKEGFGVLAAEASTYLTLPAPAHPKLVLRAGAKKLFGRFPFQEAAFIGGRMAVRSLEPQRYAGDAALVGTAELQIPLARFALVLPFNVGVYGYSDAGRVYLNGSSPGGWHAAAGLGAWIGILNPNTSLSIETGKGHGLTGVRLRTGMIF